MSPKELQYIEDALGHEQFLKSQCQQAAGQLTDPELRNTVNQLLAKHQELFSRFFGICLNPVMWYCCHADESHRHQRNSNKK